MKTKIIDINNIVEDCYAIRLECPENYHWIPGQFLKISIPDKTKEFRIFSIASIPAEKVILLGTKSRGEDISDFKKILFALEPGDEVEISAASGVFNLKDETTPIVMFASGIGITPILALIKALESDQPVELVYACLGEYYFKAEIEAILATKPNIKIYYTVTVEETTAQLMELCEKYQNAAYYYTSGSPGVIKAVQNNYRDHGIDKNRLVADSFVGY